MAAPITIDDAFGANRAAGSRSPPAPITFDEALAERTAKTRNVVDVERLQRAQQFHDMGKEDPYFRDPRMGDGEDIPIDSYMRTEAPQLLPAQSSNFMTALKASVPEDLATRRRILAQELFPGDPAGINRVGFVDDKPVYVDDNGQLREVAGLVAVRAFSRRPRKSLAASSDLSPPAIPFQAQHSVRPGAQGSSGVFQHFCSRSR